MFKNVTKITCLVVLFLLLCFTVYVLSYRYKDNFSLKKEIKFLEKDLKQLRNINETNFQRISLLEKEYEEKQNASKNKIEEYNLWDQRNQKLEVYFK